MEGIKILAFSDTHGNHKKLTDKIKAEGDVDILLCAGDITDGGSQYEFDKFVDWLDSLENCKYKVFIAGNHDFYPETSSQITLQKFMPEGIFYLCNSGINLLGYSIWGTPYVPRFYDWAFMAAEEDLKFVYDQIPLDTDILITHGPPLGVKDRTKYGQNAGSRNLNERIRDVKPILHVFGHIHEDKGPEEFEGINCVNVSCVNLFNQLNTPEIPLVCYLDKKDDK